MKSVQVCLSPALLPFYELDDAVAVVIDIFRASSSICYGLANGAKAIIPVADLDECLPYRGNGCLVAAERNGEVVEGFDFGNSPFSYTKENIAEKTVVLTTTNGTQAIRRCLAAKRVVIGSFLNITTLSDWLRKQDHPILLVCSGWKNHFSLEDTVFAGAVVNRLKTDGTVIDDAAQAAESLYLEARGDLATYLRKSSHHQRMQRLHIEQDIAFCLREDLVSVIPVLEGKELVCLNEPAAPVGRP
ncbi:2-phosphosulfolactate phosphatase [Parapedobacter deserti]|uniref:Probable 2-phosphosulfolactate phosphatase n=1 Tax=Parapedobacter deserti TaxID=1912957 RepID=A0ABV7JNP0_9SPHI